MTGEDLQNRHELFVIQMLNLAVLAVAIGVAAIEYDLRTTWGVALGGLVGAVNFWFTSWVIRRTFVPENATGSGGSGLVFLKFGGLFTAVGVLIWTLRPDSVAFGVGFTTVLVAIVLKALVDLARQLGSPEEFEQQERDDDGI